MTDAIDVNCLWGTWPFRKLRRSSFSDLQAIHRETGFSRGYVSCMNSIFYQDPFEGETDLHKVLEGTPYRQILTVNPTLPAWESDVEEGLARFGIAGVRVFPCYHGYRLDDPRFLELCRKLKGYRLPLLLTTHVEDERFDYLLLQRRPELPGELTAFLRAAPEIPILLLSLRFGEIGYLTEELHSMPNLYLDTSCLKDPVECTERLLEAIGDRKLVYGSQYPLNALRSTLCEVTMAKIPEESKNRILRDNALEFFHITF